MITTSCLESSVQTTGFKKILIALDYQEPISAVFNQALDIAKAHNSAIKLFYCRTGEISGVADLPIYPGFIGYGSLYDQDMLTLEQNLIEESAARIHAWLDGFVQEATQQGLLAEFDDGFGEPGRQICLVAQEWDADLIVMGRRGHRGFSEWLLGSVSNYVIHHASCSVLVVQHSS
jgi:nucleotide-binding universal stress UspA family protein